MFWFTKSIDFKLNRIINQIIDSYCPFKLIIGEVLVFAKEFMRQRFCISWCITVKLDTE